MNNKIKDAHALVTQAAFLFNAEQEMLLLQLPDHRWQLPGGKLRCGECWQDGLRREILEETGLDDVKIVRVLYADNWFTQTHDYYRTYFLCTTISNTVQLSRDHIAYRWIKPSDDLSWCTFTHQTVRQHILGLFATL